MTDLSIVKGTLPPRPVTQIIFSQDTPTARDKLCEFFADAGFVATIHAGQTFPGIHLRVERGSLYQAETCIRFDSVLHTNVDTFQQTGEPFFLRCYDSKHPKFDEYYKVTPFEETA